MKFVRASTGRKKPLRHYKDPEKVFQYEMGKIREEKANKEAWDNRFNKKGRTLHGRKVRKFKKKYYRTEGSWTRDKRLMRLGYRSYSEYLQSNYWKAIRQAYCRSRYPKMCLICRNPEFELHHRGYKRIGQECFGDLVPLCRKCHEKIHNSQYKNLFNIWVVMKHITRMTSGAIKRRLKEFGIEQYVKKWEPILNYQLPHKEPDV